MTNKYKFSLFLYLFSMIIVQPIIGQKEEILKALENGPKYEKQYHVELSESYKVKKILKVCEELELRLFQGRTVLDTISRGAYTLWEYRSGSRREKERTNSVIVMKKNDYAIEYKISREKYNNRLELQKQAERKFEALKSKRYKPYEGDFKFTGVWEKITDYNDIHGKSNKLPKYIIFYEKMGKPFFKVSFDEKIDTLKMKYSETLTPAPSLRFNNKWAATISLSFEEYHFWAIDTNHITLGSQKILKLRDENIYKKREDLGEYIGIFDLTNIVDFGGKTYIRTKEGYLVLNLFEMIDIEVKWNGEVKYGYCTGRGKLSYKDKFEINPPYFEGTLEKGIPVGYGCIKFSDNAIWDCGEYIDGKMK